VAAGSPRCLRRLRRIQYRRPGAPGLIAPELATRCATCQRECAAASPLLPGSRRAPSTWSTGTDVSRLGNSGAPCGVAHRAWAIRFAHLALIATVLGACAGLPPGADYPKAQSVALAHPDETMLGKQFATAARQHEGKSGFRIITIGVDGFATRMQMIDAAERTLDLQYFIFRGDETGRLLTDALLRAADRGVRVRVLIDDGDTISGDEQIVTLDAHPNVEVRIFNPFAYRGHAKFLRGLEFLFSSRRLDYRMHNKLLVVDNAVAIIGGRNIGNQYFQMDPESQFADDDVFAAGGVAGELSVTFDEYWNSEFSIPAKALARKKQAPAEIEARRERASAPSSERAQASKTNVIDYVARSATGEPYAGIVSGRLPLVWAHAQVVCDSPDKKRVENGSRAGRLIIQPLAATASAAQSELLIVTPYFIPADDELQILADLRRRNVHVGVLTNSLESSPDPLAQAGYMHYRVPLLKDGVNLYEIRSLLGNASGSGQTLKLSRYGTYALHAKLYVFDRQKLFIGSANFDQRSSRINTEVGLIIDSGQLARQAAARFDAMVQPENSYALALRPGSSGAHPRLLWTTQENGKSIEYVEEPARSSWQRQKASVLSLLPLGGEL
jgi:cardiolipin synthase C